MCVCVSLSHVGLLFDMISVFLVYLSTSMFDLYVYICAILLLRKTLYHAYVYYLLYM